MQDSTLINVNTENVFLGTRGTKSLELTIPTLDTVESLLSFANTTVEYVGRADELKELQEFLAADSGFSWWVWTGPAGIGKSRLAVELCRFASAAGWHAGFLRETDQERVESFDAERATLVVVDYAAQRSKWLSDFLAVRSWQHHQFPVRILVLERSASGEWWSVAQRVNRMEESFRVTAAMYANPRPISGLDRVDARTLVNNMAIQLDATPLTVSQIEHIVDRAEDMDPALRPLFVQVATIDRLDRGDERSSRDDMLRRVIARKTAWLNDRIAPQSAAIAQNLRFFATSLGGMTFGDYEALRLLSDPLNDLLPDAFQNLGSSVAVDDLLDGIRPDIVGELFVLDRLGSEPMVARASARLLGYAARTRSDAYRGFVERVVADHADHSQLLPLLQASSNGETALSNLEQAVAVMQLLGRSDHAVIEWIFDRINAAIEEGLVDTTCRLLTTIRFKFANLIYQENDPQRAYNLYTEALTDCDPSWAEYASILNNRGITLHQLGKVEAAATDFSAVIEAQSATAEFRACALNNRADIFDDQGNTDRAIADRSAVLELSGTSYDRRYIALARRAQTQRKLGSRAEAYDDISRILSTEDIAIEQKMQARLLRVDWSLEDGDPVRALADLDEITGSYRNFASVEKEARERKVALTTNLQRPHG